MAGAGVKLHKSASELQVYSQFDVGDTIGTGGFSTVYKARDNDSGDIVAIKVIDRSMYASKDSTMEREIDILTKVQHPHVIKLRSVFYTEHTVFMVMEYAAGGEMLARIGRQIRFPENQAAYIIRQLLSAIAHLHTTGIVHRDIKLENILLADRRGLDIKLADFGLSKCFEHDPLQTMCGSPQYVSPEILAMAESRKGIVPPKAYTPAVDIWSTGVVLFMLLSGYSPFDDDEDINIFRKIRHGKCDTDDPIWKKISPSAKDLVAGMLMVNPSRRLTAQQALEHPWILYHERRAATEAPPSKPPRTTAHAIHADSANDGRAQPAAAPHQGAHAGRGSQGGEPAEGESRQGGAEGAAASPGGLCRTDSGDRRGAVNSLVKGVLGKLKLSSTSRSE